MNKLLLGTIALLGVSSAVYGKLYPRDGVPQGDCLEMICRSNVCMEDGNLKGSCCPVDLPGAGEACTECGCKVGTCKNGRCTECEKDASSCKKCGSDNRYYYPASGSWVGSNACTRCDGKGGMYNIERGAWVGNNSCSRCDGNGGTYNLPRGEWGDSNACSRCDGNGGTYNLPQGEWGDSNVCTRCDGKGNLVNAENCSNRQPDGRICLNGVLTYDTTNCPCPNTCSSGGDVPAGTVFNSGTMTRGQDCSCNCSGSMKWTNQNRCCNPIERVDGSFDCQSFSYSNAYNNYAPNATRPYYKTEFSGTYKDAHRIHLNVKGVDDDFVVSIGNKSYGPYWGQCLGLGSGNVNNHKKNLIYTVPADTLFQLKILDKCPTNIGINYSISFDD